MLNQIFEFTANANIWPDNLIGIYCIASRYDNKKYVGQTICSEGFRGRWENHRGYLRRGDHDNMFLQHSYDKHNENEFEFRILEICNREDNLNRKEKFWIEQLQSMYFQNGWNIEYIDNNGIKRQDYRPTNPEKWGKGQILDSLNNIIEIHNITKFAKEKGLDPGNVNKLINGKSSSYKGYKSVHPNIIEKQRKRKIHRILSPDDILYEFLNIEQFCKEHNLNSSNLSAVLGEKMVHSQGWRLPYEPEKYKYRKISPHKIYEFVSPSLVLHRFKNIKLFCLKYNLKIRAIKDIIIGYRLNHKNWRKLETKENLNIPLIVEDF